MTTNDKPVCYQIRCIDARIPGVWGSHDCAESRDLLAKSWDERGVKYETRDLYARPQPAAPQVPWVPSPEQIAAWASGWRASDELDEPLRAEDQMIWRIAYAVHCGMRDATTPATVQEAE